MIEEMGVITQVGKGVITVETQVKTTCSACVANDNCGTGVVAKAFAPKTDALTLPCDQDVRVGQTVKLGIPESTIIQASALVYCVPLLVLVISALLAQLFLPSIGLDSELWVVLLSALSTAGSFMIIKRWLTSHPTRQFEPRLLQVLPHQKQVIETRPV